MIPTWTTDHSILIARDLCGYEIETSPAGKVYCFDGERRFPLPDLPNDPGEALLCLEAWLRIDRRRDVSVVSCLLGWSVALKDHKHTHHSQIMPTLTLAIAWALYRAMANGRAHA